MTLLRSISIVKTKKNHFEKQAARMGTDIRYGLATKVDFSTRPLKVEIDEEKWIEANAVIIKPKPVLKVGDRVRMFDGKAIGSIDKIEKNKAVVNYGVFTSTVSLEVLEFVEAKK